jgi:hypothetical protein
MLDKLLLDSLNVNDNISDLKDGAVPIDDNLDTTDANETDANQIEDPVDQESGRYFVWWHKLTDAYAQLPSIPMKYKRVLKASFAYFLASLLTFWDVPFEFIGGISTHLAGLAIFFFNPSRTRGALYETVFLGIIGLIYGCLMTLATALLVVTLNQNEHYKWAKIAGVVGVGGLGTFGVASAKAWLKRPSVYTAGSVASLIMYVGLARIIAGEPHTTEINWDALIGPQKAIIAGMLISVVVNWCIWTHKASTDLQ